MILYPCGYREDTEDDSITNGRNLAVIFSAEIAKYKNQWEWIQDRLDMRFFKGLHIKDFLLMTADGENHQMQIAGINTYKRTTDQNIDDHIDFISRDCYSQTVQWNTAHNNNGTAAQEHPYLASNIKQFLDQLYNKLPADVKAYIVTKRTLLEKRYSSSGALKESNGWGWADLGKLWLPAEYEVYGSVNWGTKGWSVGQSAQYPIFIGGWKNRIKGAGPGGARCSWWLSSVGGGIPLLTFALSTTMVMPTIGVLLMRCVCRSASGLKNHKIPQSEALVASA